MIKKFYITQGPQKIYGFFGVPVLILTLLVLTVLIAGLFIKAGSERELEYQKKRLREFQSIINEYRGIKEELSKTQAGLKNKALIEEINYVLSTTGLKEKMKALKQNPNKKETSFGTIEEAEVVMEKLTMNELANLLYQIDQRHSITISRLNIKRAFDAPELLNLTIMLSSLKEK
ncbi:MAG: hypothetical protein ACK4TF_07060 [Thermodesulfovibrionales bacterium]